MTATPIYDAMVFERYCRSRPRMYKLGGDVDLFDITHEDAPSLDRLWTVPTVSYGSRWRYDRD